MLRAELKKFLSFKMIWVLLACLLCVNGYLKITNAYDRYYTPNEYNSYLSEVSGMTTQEVLGHTEKKIESSDSNKEYPAFLLYDVAEICTELLNYPNYLKKLTDDADNMTAVSIWGGGDTFSYRNIIATPSAYKDLNPNILPFDTSLGTEDFLDSPATDLLALALLFICVSRIFLHDKEQGIIPLLYSTPNGRGRLIMNKVAVSVVCAVILVLVFFTEVFLIEYCLYGYGDLSRPIQSVFGYYTCDLSISVGGYMLLYIFMKMLAYSVFAVIFSFVCTISKNNLTVYGLSAVICGGSYIMYSNISSLSPFSLLHYWNPVQCLQVKEILGTYTNVNVIGYPISLKISIVIVAVLLIVALVLSIYFIFGKTRNLQYKNITLSGRLGCKKKTRSMFYYTCKRYLIEQKGILILLLTVVISLGFSRTISRYYDNDEIYYEKFCTDYAGEINENTNQFISDKLKFYRETEQQITELENSAKPSYFKLNELYAKLGDKSAFERFEKRIESIPNDSSVYYDTGYERYFGLDDNDDNSVILLVLMLSLVFVLSPVPSQDRKTNLNKIIFSTRSGKKRYFKNILLFSLLVAVISSLIVSIPYLIHILIKYDTTGLFDPVNGIVGLSAFPHFISVGIAMIFVILLRTIFAAVCAAVITLISSQCKGTVTAYCINSVIFVLPVIIKVSGLIG